MTLSPRLSSRIWAIQKEIKDAYPKKVCHMPKRHKKKSAKKREKMHTQKRYVTCPQYMLKEKEKRRKKNIAHVQEKYKERDRSCKGVHPLFNKNIPHTCTS